MKVIIAGSRNFNNYKKLCEYCDIMLSNTNNVEIVSGTAAGADRLGMKYAIDRLLVLKEFPADWDTFGKSAGYKRNEQMAQYADALIAFWDGKSKGTKHMIDLAKEYDLKIRIYITE